MFSFFFSAEPTPLVLGQGDFAAELVLVGPHIAVEASLQCGSHLMLFRGAGLSQ